MSSQHDNYKRVVDKHRRHARMAAPEPEPAKALNPPLPVRDIPGPAKLLKARFSPTASYPGGSTTSAAVIPPLTSTQKTTSAAVVTTSISSTSTKVVVATTSKTSSSSTSTSIVVVTPITTSSSSSSIIPLTTSSLTTSSSEVLPSLVPASTMFSNVLPLTSTTSSAPAATSSAATGSGTSTSAIVGGIAGGLVGVAGLIFLTMFIMRKLNKRRDDDGEFSADAFRRQSAILIDDEPNYGGGNSYNPRPPTMIERHMNNSNNYAGAPPMPSKQYYNNIGNSGGAFGGEEFNFAGAGLQRQPTFSPGQIVSPPPGQQQQYFDPAYDAGYNGNGVTRQPSNGAAALARQPSDAQAHYVDLDRSSVTPFQAAQYAEISRQLSNDGHHTGGGLHVVNENEQEPEEASPFGDSHVQQRTSNELAPPSPIYSMNGTTKSAGRERIISSPPKLPEITVQDQEQRMAFSPTSYDFPQTPSVRPTPSPYSTSFNLPSPDAQQQMPQPPAPVQVVPGLSGRRGEVAPKGQQAQRPSSQYTVYDEADAYGGF